MIINKNLIILGNIDDRIILKIGSYGDIITLSEIEYDIITVFSKLENTDLVIDYYKDSIVIDENTLSQLIKIAVNNNILVSENETNSLNSISIRPKLNNKIIEILNINISNTTIEKKIEKFSKTNLFFYSFFILIPFLLIFIILNKNVLNIKEQYLNTLYNIPYNFSYLILPTFFLFFISIFIHELGHYLLYKRFNGKSSMFGVGLLFFFIPVFYNRIYPSLIVDKKNRILIYLGGIIFDFISSLIIIIISAYIYNSFPIITFLLYNVLLSILFRAIFNLNFFLINTDGYNIFSELISNKNLFNYSKEYVIKSFKENSYNLRFFLYLFFSIFSYLSILFSWLFFLIPLFFYVYKKII